MQVDVALLTPIESDETEWLDRVRRTNTAPALFTAVRARHRVEQALGFGLDALLRVAQSHTTAPQGFRSAGAVVLATSLERAGLSWHVVDPGMRRLSYWRRKLRELRGISPRLVAVNTTFIMEDAFLRVLCALVRDALPEATLAVGGYLYATSAERFLSVDADVFCIGEGETRIVDIARAVLGEGDLDTIPGLYVRTAGGSLRFTGAPKPLRLENLPEPDWTLSARMDPPHDPHVVGLDYVVETQRGCFFKCDFCTYRTLASMELAGIEHAARAILGPAAYRATRVQIADATATYPPERWKAILRRVIELGGSPHPVMAYARVSDLDDEACALMAQANVRSVFIGQEAGDQRLLNAMRKGTRVDQVQPALAAMARHGVHAMFGFIHGFPGEDESSLAATRAMAVSLNDECGDVPVVPCVRVEIFKLQDFAGVAQRGVVAGHHPFGHASPDVMSPVRAAHQILRTFIAMGLEPKAPATCFGLHRAVFTLSDIADDGALVAAFHWFKQLDHALAMLCVAEMDGARVKPGELERCIGTLRAAPWKMPAASGVAGRVVARLRHRLVRRLSSEWELEAKRAGGPGALTRILLGTTVWTATRHFRASARSAWSGELGELGQSPFQAPGLGAERRSQAQELIQLGIAVGRERKPGRAAINGRAGGSSRSPAASTPSLRKSPFAPKARD